MDPRKREFWLGGTVDPVDRARLAQADSLNEAAKRDGDAYVECMLAYARAHATGTSSPSDIADAAAATCTAPFAAMMSEYSAADDLRILAAHFAARDELHERAYLGDEQAKLAASIKELGRQAVVKAVVDRRP
jgi:hypothetical protein